MILFIFSSPVSDIDECDIPAPVCQNSGVCENTFGGFDCQCLEGFIGEFCESSEPQNGGSESSSNYGLAVIVSLGCVVMLLVIVGAAYYLWNRKKRQQIGEFFLSLF